jgi:hypothetical protein
MPHSNRSQRKTEHETKYKNQLKNKFDMEPISSFLTKRGLNPIPTKNALLNHFANPVTRSHVGSLRIMCSREGAGAAK